MKRFFALQTPTAALGLRLRMCAGTPVPAKPPLSSDQSSFLKQFREKLEADAGKTDLGHFVEQAATEELAASGVAPMREPPLGMGMPTMNVTEAAAASSSSGSAAGGSVLASAIKRGRDPLPPWLKLSRPVNKSQQSRFNKLKASMRDKKLATVCEEARCPNIGECWGGGGSQDGEHGEHMATATIMIMGDTCTRGCRFCSVKTARAPPPLDPLEPEKTATAIEAMGVGYIVITMVDRDDQADGGSAHVARTIKLVKEQTKVLLECLVGDFQGKKEQITVVAQAGLDVYAHNIECVERITPRVRDRRATYRQSLAALEYAKIAQPKLLTKSSVMLGLGEAEHEILQTLRDLRSAGVDALTLGQYLQPSRSRMKVERYVHPTEFQRWKEEADKLGFVYCASGPMVRSSYRAGEFYLQNVLKQRQQQSDVAK